MTDIPKVPLAVSELAIDRHFLGSAGTGALVPDSAISVASRAVRECRGFAEQLASSYSTTMADPSRPTAARHIQAEKVCSQLHEIAARKLDKALEAVDQATFEIERDHGRLLSPSTANEIAIAGQIRDRLYNLPEQTRIELLNKAVADGDEQRSLP